MRDWHAFVRGRLRLDDLTPAREARILRELATQLEDFYREAVADGATDADADAHAQAQITDWTRLSDEVHRVDRAHTRPAVDRFVQRIELRAGLPLSRDPGGLLMFAHAVRDTRYALRQLLRAPGFTMVAVLTLALGIGATTAMFSVVNGVLLRPLPYPGADALVRINEIVPQYGQFSVAPANFLDWRDQNRVFERIVAASSTGATFAATSGPERVQGTQVSWDTFDMLKVAPLRGATFTAEQDKLGAPPVIIISYGMWQQRFGGEESVVGRVVPVSGIPMTIIGIMPAGFYFPSRTAEFWRPLAFNPANASRGGHNLGVFARLKPDVTIAQAHNAMREIADRLAKQYPDASANESAEVVSMQQQIVGGIRPALLILFGAVGVLVLIACANVANLLLVRASVREKEIAIRTALGARRGRLAAQMLCESLVLAVAGGALGVLLGYLAITPIRTLGATSIPRVADVTMDAPVLLFTAFATILTGVLFGLAPAWQASRAGVNAVLKEGGRSSTTAGSRWIRSGLLVIEVALSIVLLTGAILLLRSFSKVTGVDPGFSPDRVLAFQVSLPGQAYPDDGKRVTFFDGLLEKLHAQPAIESAGIVQTLPLRGSYVLSFEVRGRAAARPGEGASAHYRTVSPRYFEALGVPLKKGRAFTAQDAATSQHVAVIDEAFARKFFEGQDPIGQGLDIGNGVDGFYDIVGVVGSVRYDGLETVAAPTMYVPFAQGAQSGMWVLARAKSDPAGLAAVARQVVREMDPALPAYSISPLATIVHDSIAQRRFATWLLAIFAGVALFLAAVGLYGVVAYSVGQRTREIGLRMAIGARPGDVLQMIVVGGLKLALVGVAVGLAGSMVVARMARAMLFDIAPFDPVSYVATSTLLLAIAAIACLVPALRAMRVDPIVAMHGE